MANNQYPISITLNFTDEDAAYDFMSGLADSWGEDNCSLQWKGEFDTARTFDVDLIDDDWIEEEEDDEFSESTSFFG